MAVLGIGVDIVALDRIDALCARRAEQFAARVFTEAEQQHFAPTPDIARIAARFAVKEAVSKALGTGIGAIGWREIETVSGPAGQPLVRLYGRAAELAAARGVRQIHCSISHERHAAVAMILLEG